MTSGILGTYSCRKIVGGNAEAEALVSGQPINFLAMVDTEIGKITDKKHELYGKSLKDVILVFPNAIGSSVGAYVFYSLKMRGTAPKAIVCIKADITTASGCAIANIPVVDTCTPLRSNISTNDDGMSPSLYSIIRTGSKLRVDADRQRIIATV